MTTYSLQLFQQTRNHIVNLLKEHSLEQLNTIPTGLNNNLIWNAGHLLLAQQFIMYHFSGVPLLVPAQEFMPKYASDTNPDGKSTQEEVDQIIELLETTSQKAIEDYQNKVFNEYTSYTSEYFGTTMENIDEAIQFNTLHEGFHFGSMMKIKSALGHK